MFSQERVIFKPSKTPDNERRNREERGQDRCRIYTPFLLSERKDTRSRYFPCRGKWKHESQYTFLSLCDSTSKQKYLILHKTLESKFPTKKAHQAQDNVTNEIFLFWINFSYRKRLGFVGFLVLFFLFKHVYISLGKGENIYQHFIN